MRGKIKISVWIESNEIEKFILRWDQLFDNISWYKDNDFRKDVPEVYIPNLYLYQSLMGSGTFIKLQLDLKDYRYWLEKTKI
tara:strand:- start:39 stop:284 length:246 start_codon:yes stop_codon:yes gene_type:complete